MSHPSATSPSCFLSYLSLNSWHRIHRTRHWAYVPATTCPAGANTLVTVVSGILEVLVYAPADGLPCLKPTFGKASCTPGLSFLDESSFEKPGKHNADNSGSEEEGEKHNGRPFGGDHASTSPKLSLRAVLMDVFGLDSERVDQDDQSVLQDFLWTEPEDAEKGDRGGEKGAVGKADDEQGLQRPGAAENMPNGDRGHSSHSSQSLLWPHEPRYCADMWRENDEDEPPVTR